MGALSLWQILFGIALPGIAFALLWPLLRRFVFTRIPDAWRPPTALFGISIMATVLLAVLATSGPDEVSAVTPPEHDDTTEGPDEAAAGTHVGWLNAVPGLRRWRVHLFPLEDWGDQLRRLEAGTHFTRVVNDDLRARGILSKKGEERELPVHIFQVDTRIDQATMERYRRLAPFVAVGGHIAIGSDGRLEARALVRYLGAVGEPETILERQMVFSESEEARSQAAIEFAGELYEAIMRKTGS